MSNGNNQNFFARAGDFFNSGIFKSALIGIILAAAIITVDSILYNLTGIGGIAKIIAIRGFKDLGKIGLILFIFQLAVFALIASMVRGEGLMEGATRAYVGLLNRLKRTKMGAKIFGDLLEQRDPTIKGELPFVFKDIRLELFTLWNWMLRHEVFLFKSETTKKLTEEMMRREEIIAERIPTIENIHKNLKGFIEGGEIKEDITTESRRNTSVEIKRWTTKGGHVGFARQHYLVYQMVNMLADLLEQDLTEPIHSGSDSAHEVIRQTDIWKGILDSHVNTIEDIYGRYGAAVRRFKVLHLIRAMKLYYYDMYNLYGMYKRGIYYARPDAQPEYYTYNNAIKRPTDDDVFDLPQNSRILKIDLDKVEYAEKEPRTRIRMEESKENYEVYPNYLVEVNIYGWCLTDINKIEREGDTSERYIRKYRKDDIIHLPNIDTNLGPRYNKVMQWASMEWEFWKIDLETGRFHPFSRSIANYNALIAKSHFDFSKAEFNGELSIEQIAFDREALKNPGLWRYRGRKRYYDTIQDSLREEPKNPYPVASLIGTWLFIRAFAKRRIADPELADQYLRSYFNLGYTELEKMEAKKE